MSSFEVRGRVLIIDDEEDWRDTIAETLELCGGYVFEKAKDSKTAKDLLANQEFDIVTIDMELKEKGKLSGEMLLDLIRKKYKTIACVMISASQEINFGKVDDLKEEHGLGAFVHKDEFTVSALNKAIEKAKKIIEREKQKALEDNIEVYLQTRKLDTLRDYRQSVLELERVLAKQKNIYSQLQNNLMEVQSKAAMYGIDVPIHILNEINEYKQKCAEAREDIEKTKDEILDTEHKIDKLEKWF